MKVNLGCGTTHVLQDWVNIDGSLNARLAQYPRIRRALYDIGILPEDTYDVPWEEHIDDVLVHDVRNGLPFENGSVEYVFSSHLIEHLPKEGGVELLRECRRILKPDGVVRISTPDLRRFVDDYIQREDDESATDNPGADVFINRLGFPVEEVERSFFERLLDTTVYRLHDHKWLYDVKTLSRTFEKAGFPSDRIHRQSYQTGEIPDLDRLDTRAEFSLFMEATK